MAGGCSQQDCRHLVDPLDMGSHCQVRTCVNFKFSCPVHGTSNK